MPVLAAHTIIRKLLTVCCTALAAMGILPTAVSAGDTLTRVRSAGVVRCGVNNGLEGFAVKDAAGRWSGMDVDFCRAVAAAVLGDSEKAVFTPLMASARFPVLKSKQIGVAALYVAALFYIVDH